MQRLRIFLAISSIVAVVIAFHFLGWSAPFERFFRALMRPISSQAYTWSVTIGSEVRTFASVGELEKAYMELLADRQTTVVDAAQIEILSRENEELKAQLGFVAEHGYTSLGAHVTGRGIDPISNTILIDQGREHGVQPGQAVIAGAGVLVGRVVRVDPESALVRLLQDPQSRIGATILNTDRTLGVLEGGYGVSVHMNFIPQNETVDVGQTIVTSGLGGDVLRGLVVGTVEAIERAPYEPFQRAIVTPLINADALSLVSVLLSP